VKTIQWQFVAEPWYRDPGSAAIRWFSAGPASHVDSITPTGLNWALPGMLYGARADRVGGQPPGVWVRPPGYTRLSWRCVATIPVTDDQWFEFWSAERAKFGLPYDKTAIWGFAAGRNWRETNSWFCSEKQIDSAEKAKIVQPLPGLVSKVTPAGAINIVSQVEGTTFEVFAQ